MYKSRFDFAELDLIKDRGKRILYCHSYLKFLGEGCYRQVFLLPNGKVLKVANSHDAYDCNLREEKIYYAAPEKYRKNLLKVFYSHPKGWYLVCERVKTYISRKDFPFFDPTETDYQWKNAPTWPQTRGARIRFRKLRNTTRHLVKEYGLNDLSNPDNWGTRKSGKFVIIDYAS